MSMERMGLVARVEKDLEQVIALGLLPRDGFLPSEQVLARQQGVSRATTREALLRLAARGLVVQHPGRRSRAVPLSQAVTLENLSVVLHARGPADLDGRRLLEGYFALKRDTLVELLASCCERASEEELSRLGTACFVLGGTAPWEPQSCWAEREFELLRLAALIANRPGHFLLVQSLERSFWGMAGRLLPHVDYEAIRQWSRRASSLLDDRDAQALRRELPSMLLASEEHLLRSLASDYEADSTPQPPPIAEEPLLVGHSEQGSTEDAPPGADSLHRSACQTNSGQAPPAEAPLPESEPGAVLPNPSACQTAVSQSSSAGRPLPELKEGELGSVSPHRSGCQTEERRVGTAAANWSACHTGAGHGLPVQALPRVHEGREPGAVLPERSGCQTGSCQALPAQTPPRQLPSSCSGQSSSSLWSPVPWGRASALAGAWQGQALAALRAESSLVTAARSLSRWGSSSSSASGSNWKSACLSLSRACMAPSPDWPA